MLLCQKQTEKRHIPEPVVCGGAFLAERYERRDGNRYHTPRRFCTCEQDGATTAECEPHKVAGTCCPAPNDGIAVVGNQVPRMGCGFEARALQGVILDLSVSMPPSHYQRGFLDKLAAIVGEAGLVADPADMAPYIEETRGLYEGASPAVANPTRSKPSDRRRERIASRGSPVSGALESIRFHQWSENGECPHFPRPQPALSPAAPPPA